MWNPWRALREREDVRLEFRRLHPSAGGGRWDQAADGSRVITIDASLGRRARNAVLAHELVHDERGIAAPDAPPLVMQREEACVRLTTALRLVPLPRLAAFVAQRSEYEAITAELVAEEFDVPVAVAAEALRRLAA